MNLTLFYCLMAGLLSLAGFTAGAAQIVVNSGQLYDSDASSNINAEGSGRGQGFQALSSFSITSVGIEADLIPQSFDVQVYASTNGRSVGSLLASSSGIVGGLGLAFHDLPISFSFTAGNYYVVNWRPSNGSFTWVNNNDNISFYRDDALPVTVGPIRLLDGIEGFGAGDASNFLHPNLRYNVGMIPEPTALAVTLLGVLVGATHRVR